MSNNCLVHGKNYQDECLECQDQVNHPKHYTQHPSGVECIDIAQHMNFNLGNVLKYIWRCDLKRDDVEDLRKALFYLQREIELRTKDGG